MKRHLKLIIGKGEAGFAIPIVLGVGLIMMLIATIMLVRSQSDRTLATAKTSTDRALIAAETGVTKVQVFLNRHRSLATRPNIYTDNWSSFVTNDIEGLGCTAPTNLDLDVPKFDAADPSNPNNGWIEIYTDPDGLKREYRVISYNYNLNNNRGDLIVEGRTRQNTIVRSTARLQVTIPVSRNPPTTFKPPAIWARTYNLGTNNFKVDAAIKFGCDTPLDTSKFIPKTQPSTKIIEDRSLYLPKIPLLPPQCPPAPATLTAANKPCYIKIAAITASETFPRPIDINLATGYGNDGTGNNKEYIYYIEKAGANSVNLSLVGTDKITIPFNPTSLNSQKVTLYLQGNFQANVEHNCPPPPPPPSPTPSPTPSPLAVCKSTDLQIFGLSSTQQVTLKTDSILDTFVLAPQATAKLEGNGQIRGAMWVKTWGLSSKTGTVVEQPDKWEWTDLPNTLRPDSIPPNIAPYTAWQRQEIN